MLNTGKITKLWQVLSSVFNSSRVLKESLRHVGEICVFIVMHGEL